MNEIGFESSNTPVNSPLFGRFIPEVLHEKLRRLLAQQPARNLEADCGTTAPASAASSTTVPWVQTSSPLDSRVVQKQYPRVCDSIASRLPARSQATNHRLLVVRTSTSIAGRLLPRTVNAATQNRGRTRAIPNRQTGRIGLGIRKKKSAQSS